MYLADIMLQGFRFIAKDFSSSKDGTISVLDVDIHFHKDLMPSCYVRLHVLYTYFNVVMARC